VRGSCYCNFHYCQYKTATSLTYSEKFRDFFRNSVTGATSSAWVSTQRSRASPKQRIICGLGGCGTGLVLWAVRENNALIDVADVSEAVSLYCTHEYQL
jgi:hypothetical protein